MWNGVSVWSKHVYLHYLKNTVLCKEYTNMWLAKHDIVLLFIHTLTQYGPWKDDVIQLFII